MSLPNFTRKYYNESLDYICKLTGKKRKELEMRLKGSDDNAIANYVSYSTDAMRWRRKITEGMHRGLNYSSYFVAYIKDIDNALRLCVPTLPDKFVDCNAIDTSIVDEHNLLIDFRYIDIDCMLDVRRNICKTTIGDKEFKYRIMLYMDTDMFDGENSNDIKRDYGSIQKFMPIYTIHLNDDLSDCQAEISYFKQAIHNSVERITANYIFGEVRNMDIPYFTDISELYKFPIPTPEYVLGLVKYASYCYRNRTIIHRKSCSANKYYEQHKVHISVTDKNEDKYVSLCTYVSDYYPRPKSEYKGGHHASPVDHERRGHFRRTKNHTGDYDLVDGNFVEVEHGKGEFCTVRPSHVVGKKLGVVYKTV